MTRSFSLAALALALTLTPAWCQLRPIRPMAPAAAPAPGAGLDALEKTFDDVLQTTGIPDPIQLRGFTRGLQLSGYGTVFTAEVDLVATPTINIFQRTISPQQASAAHQRKLTNLPLLRKAMREMILNSANALTALAPEDRIVVAVRLLYQSWEDRTGLPGLILMKGQRSAIQAGNIEVEEQQ
jgi:hypothetical protein